MQTRHDKLFGQYVEELRAVKAFADSWWASLLEAEERVIGSADKALISVKERWPAGPASHPRVIALIRKYFLACEALNSNIAAMSEISYENSGESVLPHSIAEGAMDQDNLHEEDLLEQEGEVQPGQFLAERLLSSKTMDLAQFVVRLGYWPIGEDEIE